MFSVTATEWLPWVVGLLLAVFAIVAIVRKLIFIGIVVLVVAIAAGVGGYALL